VYTGNLTVSGNKYLTGTTGVNRLYENMGNLTTVIGNNGNIVIDYNTVGNGVVYGNMSGVVGNMRLTLSNIPYSTIIPTGSFSSVSITAILFIPSSQAAYIANTVTVSSSGTASSTVITPLSSGGLSNISLPTLGTARYLVQQFNVIFPGTSTPIIFTNVLWMY
jgi:hypothetical protein